MSKQSNDPIDDCFSKSFAFCRRSRRRRSKSMRFSQSTAIVPCVLSAMNQLLAASFRLLARCVLVYDSAKISKVRCTNPAGPERRAFDSNLTSCPPFVQTTEPFPIAILGKTHTLPLCSCAFSQSCKAGLGGAWAELMSTTIHHETELFEDVEASSISASLKISLPHRAYSDQSTNRKRAAVSALNISSNSVSLVRCLIIYAGLHILLAAWNTDSSVGTVTSSSGGENGIGTCIAPIRFTGAS